MAGYYHADQDQALINATYGSGRDECAACMYCFGSCPNPQHMGQIVSEITSGEMLASEAEEICLECGEQCECSIVQDYFGWNDGAGSAKETKEAESESWISMLENASPKELEYIKRVYGR